MKVDYLSEFGFRLSDYGEYASGAGEGRGRRRGAPTRALGWGRGAARRGWAGRGRRVPSRAGRGRGRPSVSQAGRDPGPEPCL